MIENVKELTQVASPPAPSTADGARRIGGDVVDSAVDATKRVVRKTLDDVSMTPFLRKITFFASGGAFLDGYVLSLIGVALTQIVPAFSLTTEQSALIGASVLVGIFFGTILGMVGVGPVMAPIITKLGPVVDKWAGTVREPEPAK